MFIVSVAPAVEVRAVVGVGGTLIIVAGVIFCLFSLEDWVSAINGHPRHQTISSSFPLEIPQFRGNKNELYIEEQQSPRYALSTYYSRYEYVSFI